MRLTFEIVLKRKKDVIQEKQTGENIETQLGHTRTADGRKNSIQAILPTWEEHWSLLQEKQTGRLEKHSSVQSEKWWFKNNRLAEN